VADRCRELEQLEGRVVSRWWGIEMALYETRPAGRPVFSHAAVPFLQFTVLGATFEDGVPANFRTYQNNTEFGLVVRTGSEATVERGSPEAATSGTSIYRNRDLPELPTGSIDEVAVKPSDLGDIAGVSLLVDGSPLLLLAGEVHERWDLTFDLVLGDESVLVFVDPADAETVPWVNPPADTST
jgi:hypothetical protein